MTLSSDPSARRARWAVAAMFLAHGFVLGSWAPQIPLLLPRLSITETTVGLLILVFGLGALVAMPVSAALMARHGSRPVLAISALATALALPLVVLMPTTELAALAMILFGAVVGAMDVAMNTNAVAVEKRLGRAIMSSSHGFWSLGGFIGGGLGGFVIEWTGTAAHSGFVAAAAFLVAIVSLAALAGESGPAAIDPAAPGRPGLPRRASLYLLGMMALFCMVPEGAVLDWAALHLRQALGADIATAGLAFSFFSGAMAIMRFAGDRVRNRFGPVGTLRISALIASAGLLAASLSPSAPFAILFFALAGLGIANTVPIVFSAAGAQPGISSSAGMGVVTTMGYSGILLAPSAIGFIGERTGFAPVFAATAGLLLVVAFMARLAAPRQGRGLQLAPVPRPPEPEEKGRVAPTGTAPRAEPTRTLRFDPTEPGSGE